MDGCLPTQTLTALQRGDQGNAAQSQGFPGPAGPPRGLHGQQHMRPMQPWRPSQQQQFHSMPGPPRMEHRPHGSARPSMQTPGHGRPFQPRPPAARPSSGFQSKPKLTGCCHSSFNSRSRRPVLPELSSHHAPMPMDQDSHAQVFIEGLHSAVDKSAATCNAAARIGQLHRMYTETPSQPAARGWPNTPPA